MFAEFLLLFLIFPWAHTCVGSTIDLRCLVYGWVVHILLLTISGHPF